MDQRDTIALHRQWWQRQNTLPLASHYYPLDLPYGGLDNDIPPREIGPRKRANAEAKLLAAQRVNDDCLIVEAINFSVAFVPAVAGAGYAHDAHTSWSLPVTDNIENVRIPPFNPHHPLWCEYEKRLEILLKHWSYSSYLPSLADYLGPMDILAAFLGPENLSLALYENPQAVKKRALDAAEFLKGMIAYELQLHASAGLTEGVTDVFGVWLPKRGVRTSEDFSALVGPDHFREFFHEPLSRVFESLDSCFLHTHSAALQCLQGFTSLRHLGALELGNDPGGPDLEQRINAAKAIQAKGLPLQMGSWNIQIRESEMKRLVSSLDPRGLLVRFQAATPEEAQELYAAVKSWAKKVD